eukprot:TRINITY_DN7571_c0_g1_i1.p1 TRINITY_DN7571_c0_g1~~TRINITY_DN7571_c0_g1_i1.p1  ORF type:complete len:585 (+),score=123.26 TRINITY_DN7571_c0_g1_i1:70-1824(+)
MATTTNAFADEPEFMVTNTQGFLLYDVGSSSPCHRVRITLHEKGIAWDTQTMDLAVSSNRSQAYLNLNPSGAVPTLGHGERVIWDSNVITEYIDDLYPAAPVPLYPDDPWELAQVKMWQASELAVAKDYRPLMYQRLMGPMLHLTRSLPDVLDAVRKYSTDEIDLEWTRRVWNLKVLTVPEEIAHQERILQWLERLESHLMGKHYLVGDRCSMADITVYPRVFHIPFVDIEIKKERFPSIVQWMSRLSKRVAFGKAISTPEKGIETLVKTPVLSFLGKVLKRAEGEWSWHEKARIAVLRTMFDKIFGSANVAVKYSGVERPLRQPRAGRQPAQAAKVKEWRAQSKDVVDAPLTLFSYAWAPEARRIRILLGEKRLQYRTSNVDLARLANRSEQYLSLNPTGEVPTLVHGDRTIYNTAFIAEYIDRLFGKEKLFPDDAYLCAQTRMWLAFDDEFDCEYRPLFYLNVIRPILSGQGINEKDVDNYVPADVHPSHKEWLRDVIRGTPRFDLSPDAARELILRKVDAIEARLKQGRYLLGDLFTFADIALFTRVDSLAALNIELDGSRYPSTNRWLNELRSRASVSEA